VKIFSKLIRKLLINIEMNFNTDEIPLSYCKSILANIHTLVQRLTETRKESAYTRNGRGH